MDSHVYLPLKQMIKVKSPSSLLALAPTRQIRRELPDFFKHTDSIKISSMVSVKMIIFLLRQSQVRN